MPIIVGSAAAVADIARVMAIGQTLRVGHSFEGGAQAKLKIRILI